MISKSDLPHYVTTSEDTMPIATIQDIPVEKIMPSPFQVRKDFDEENLKSLAQTIKDHGLMNAINVRPMNDRYQLITGERRWRAVKLLGWTNVRAQVEEVDDKE